MDGKLHLWLDELDKAEQNAEQGCSSKHQKGRCFQMNEETIGKGVPFERIRRITGYLVGTIDRWNNAKRAEEQDRVKHTLGGK